MGWGPPTWHILPRPRDIAPDTCPLRLSAAGEGMQSRIKAQQTTQQTQTQTKRENGSVTRSSKKTCIRSRVPSHGCLFSWGLFWVPRWGPVILHPAPPLRPTRHRAKECHDTEKWHTHTWHSHQNTSVPGGADRGTGSQAARFSPF